MITLKHVGKIKSSGQKVLVAFRTLPGESDHALVLPVSTLTEDQHDSIIRAVESPEAQSAFEFGETMFSRTFPDGRFMLQAVRSDGKLLKIPTDNIIMTPQPGVEIPLVELNGLIAEQKNCAVDDLYTFVSGAPKKNETETKESDEGRDVGEPKISKAEPIKAKDNEVLTDRDIAKGLRSQADALYKEAAKMRKQADELDPPVKKTVKAKEETSA